METAKPAKWRKADVIAFPEPGPASVRPGEILENVAIVKDDSMFRPWRIVHQPSGLGAGIFRTRTAARKAIEKIRTQYGLAILDIAASPNRSREDDALIHGPIKRILLAAQEE